MKSHTRLWIWVFANMAWFILVPGIFAFWVAGEIDAQYASGMRTTFHGDSLSIPVFAVLLANTALIVVVNAALVIVLLVRRSSRRRQIR